jgi:purine-nucleoside phosphorylase
MVEDYYKKILKAAEYIKSKIDVKSFIGIILGSGLGRVVSDIKDIIEIDYKDIPHFPATTVKGHAGRLVSGVLGGKQVIAMKGRFHYYEGYDVSQVVFPVRVMKLLGIDNLMVTNAAGSINRDFEPGDLMLIKDHIGFFSPSPLRGKNIDEFGTRFPDMNEAYSRDLIDMATNASNEIGIKLKEGVYAFMQGPMFETPSEIKVLGKMGADVAGMSTVPEVITARHAGMRVLGISCITNMAAGIQDKPLNHEEVVKTAAETEYKFSTLITQIIRRWEL